MANVLTLGNKKKRVTAQDIKTLGIISYDWDNLYPQRISRTGARSPTDLAARELCSTHLSGRGFKVVGSLDLNKLVVNSKGQTLSDVHEIIADDCSQYNGCWVHVHRNGLFEITEINHVPFEHVRLCIPVNGKINQVAIYDNWASDDRKRFAPEDVKKLDIYSDDINVTMAQCAAAGGIENWKGQVAWYTSNGRLEYPLAPIDPAFERMETEHQIGVLLWRWVKNGFFPGAIITHYGKPEGITTKTLPDGTVVDDLSWQDEVVRMTNENQGAENAHNVINTFAENKEQKPDLQQFEIKNIYEQFKETEQSVIKSIIRNYGQPRALHGIDQPGSLGLSKEWEEGKKNYDERTAKKRKKLALVFLPLLNEWHEKITVTEENLTVVSITTPEKKDYSDIADKIVLVLDKSWLPPAKIKYLVSVLQMEEKDATELVNSTVTIAA